LRGGFRNPSGKDLHHLMAAKPEELPAPRVQPRGSACGPKLGTYSDSKESELDCTEGFIKFDLW